QREVHQPTFTHRRRTLAMTNNEARTLVNIIRRCERLWDDGYTFEQFNTAPWMYAVESPAGALYFVNLKQETCTCDSFENRDYCKHLYAVQKEVERQEAAERASFERWMEEQEAECSSYGCDPYAEF